MKKYFIIPAALATIFNLSAAETSSTPDVLTQHSPSGNMTLNVGTDDSGSPWYSLQYKDREIVGHSKLGLAGKEAEFLNDFAIVNFSTDTVDETWQPVWGEFENIRNNYNELAVDFKDAAGKEMTVRFRLFDDGLGFRYEFPLQDGLNYFALMDEATEISLDGNHTFFAIPGDYDTDEFLFSEAKISDLGDAMKKYKGVHSESQGVTAEGVTVQTPLLIKTADSKPVYINVHEAALRNYPAMLLDVDTASYVMKSHLVPDRLGVRGYLQFPFQTPWRTLIVSDDARDILASQLILNLNDPTEIEDTSWIKPMKFVGVWWEMFTGNQKTWAYSDDRSAKPGVTDYTKLKPNGRHPANTENVKKYIDFAAKHGIDGVLVEGWNEGWEDWASYRKNRQFLFDKPYPDFDLEYLRDYAASKGVKLIMHHETAANAADYERQLETAFKFMKDNGYDAVKTGYVGAIIPRSEHHSSQWMVDHVNYVAKRAADYKIMVDSHEAPHPTGLVRTYPNWLAQESARGGEFESMGGNPPSHTAILPFTRLKGGPMDYTPGLFETRLSTYGEGKTSQAGTTLARQLALYLTMPSPIQMAADLPENYERFPDAFTFIREVPVDWADTKYLEAEPARYITVARRDKNSEDWFIGAITDESPREALIDFSFLPDDAKYFVTIYEDGPDADYKDNPQDYMIRQIKIDRKTKLKQKLAAGGGAAMKISKAK